MSKYHISPTTGNPNKCYAEKKPCPLGGEGDHYATKEEAREAYSKKQEAAGGGLAGVKREAPKAEKLAAGAASSTASSTSFKPGTLAEVDERSIRKVADRWEGEQREVVTEALTTAGRAFRGLEEERKGKIGVEPVGPGSFYLKDQESGKTVEAYATPRGEIVLTLFDRTKAVGFDGERETWRLKTGAPAEEVASAATVMLAPHRARQRERKQQAFEASQQAMKTALEGGNFPSRDLTAPERAALARVAEGKKVKPEVLDRVIHKTERMGGLYTSAEALAAANQVTAHLKTVRRQDPTPNTLPTAGSFDPATQTVFSNPAARANATVAMKAVKREQNNSDWLRELAQQQRQSAREWADRPEMKEAHLQEAAKHEAAARESDARVQAQLRELQWVYDQGDPAFKSSMPPAAEARFKRGDWRSVPARLKDEVVEAKPLKK